MLRVYFLQNWYALSDPMAEETLYDSEAMRRFAGIELGDDRIPDETTILNFRHLLEWHGLTEAIFADALAAKLIERAPRVEPIATAEYPTRAQRPAYSRLDGRRLHDALGLRLPDWRRGVSETLAELAAS